MSALEGKAEMAFDASRLQSQSIGIELPPSDKLALILLVRSFDQGASFSSLRSLWSDTNETDCCSNNSAFLNHN